MPSLKIKDSNGNFIRVPTIGGPEGPKGVSGDFYAVTSGTNTYIASAEGYTLEEGSRG